MGTFSSLSQVTQGQYRLDREVDFLEELNEKIDLLLSSKRGVVVIVRHMQTHSYGICFLCGARASDRCSRCLLVSYCSVEHQKEHWPRHKKSCLSKTPEVWNIVHTGYRKMEKIVEKHVVCVYEALGRIRAHLPTSFDSDLLPYTMIVNNRGLKFTKKLFSWSATYATSELPPIQEGFIRVLLVWAEEGFHPGEDPFVVSHLFEKKHCTTTLDRFMVETNIQHLHGSENQIVLFLNDKTDRIFEKFDQQMKRQ